MKQAAPVFKRFLPQLWYVLGTTIFFLLFCLAYIPGWMFDYLQTPQFGYFFHITIVFCIWFICLCITRLLIYHFLQNTICQNYITYSLWCFLEIFLAAWFVAIYFCLMFDEMYFSSLGKSFGMLYMINAYPVVIITLSYVVIGFKEKPVEDSQMARFRDYSKKLKFTVDSQSILYIAAEENYLRIYYYDGMIVKDYQLRASMSSIEKVAANAGLFRCQRSYFINPNHITALKKDKLGNITAELDYGETSVKVSKKLYNDLSNLI